MNPKWAFPAALVCAFAFNTARADDAAVEAAQLRDRALRDNHAFEIVESLAREVGARSAGSPGDAKAVAWALRTLKSMGLKNVHAEKVTVPRWERGDIDVELLGAHPQKLVAVALGGSVGTTGAGITASVVMVKSIDELEALPPEQVRGRIVFYNRRMERRADGAGYGATVPVRFLGPAEAGRRGAAGVVIRSVGTAHDRVPHTGMTLYDDAAPKVPAAALSDIDADLLEQELGDGVAVQLKLKIGARQRGTARSANVVGEIPGTGKDIVLLAAHLDSWDVGPSANDDGAGVAIVSEAARMIGTLPHAPLRTIRVVLFANEEHGLSGARQYVRAHAAELPRHVLGMEADFGSGAVQVLKSQVGEAGLPAVKRMIDALAALGVAGGSNDADGGSDVGALAVRGMPLLAPRQDGTRYFDIHHTSSDTIDSVDRAGLAQNVAVYAVAAWIAAQHAPGFGRLPDVHGD